MPFLCRSSSPKDAATASPRSTPLNVPAKLSGYTPPPSPKATGGSPDAFRKAKDAGRNSPQGVDPRFLAPQGRDTFDFSASPGARDWKAGQTAEGTTRFVNTADPKASVDIPKMEW